MPVLIFLSKVSVFRLYLLNKFILKTPMYFDASERGALRNIHFAVDLVI